MNKNQLITLAANSNELKGFCKKLCDNRGIHQDMFQEFLLTLLEIDEVFIIKKFEDIQFIGYCYWLLRRMNSHRIRSSQSYTNSKNPLAERKYIPIISDGGITDVLFDGEDWNEYLEDRESNDFIDHSDQETDKQREVEEKFNRTMEFMNQTKSIKKYHAILLYASVDKPTREIAEITGSKQRSVIYQINKTKELIKQNVK